MEEILIQLGLTSSEAKVYLSLLELGESKTGEILSKAGLNSGRIYEILGSLEKKGLVSSIIKHKVKYFSPSPPERILDLLNEKAEEIKNKKINFEEVLPSLTNKFKSLKEKTNVEVYYGIEGQRTAYSVIFKENSRDLYVYGITGKESYSKMTKDAKKVLDILVYYVYKKRRELGLNIKKLAYEEARGEKDYLKDNSKIKYLPYPSLTSIEILGNVTMIQLPIEPFITILIHNKQVTKDYERQFEFLWKLAKN